MACVNNEKYYSLAPEATSDCPRSIEELDQWLLDQDKTFRGKLYVARSIKWNGNAFIQDGCGPCYLKKRWSLACCKHDMRSSHAFRKQIEDSHRPYFIFTLASNIGSGLPKGGQALVSVARVTKSLAFETMQDYASFLCRQTQDIKLSRLTRQPVGKMYKGWQFGDCHADCKGELGRPNRNHSHSKGNEWESDRDSKGLILFSDHFLIWKDPRIISCVTIRQDRWGRDISPDRLGEVLKNL